MFFGLRVDRSLPSKNLDTIASSAYWPGVDEEGRILFHDKRTGKKDDSKEVSSDHRLVWNTIRLKY